MITGVYNSIRKYEAQNSYVGTKINSQLSQGIGTGNGQIVANNLEIFFWGSLHEKGW